MVDVTARIKIIESLKCALLKDLSDLYENMRVPAKQDDRDESLTALLVHTYLLSSQLGISYESLDRQVIQYLKNENAMLKNDSEIKDLLRHLYERRVQG